jgi:hypothetical protein
MQVVQQHLQQERMQQRAALVRHQASMRAYAVQRPLEEARMQMLRAAGLPAGNVTPPPVKPRMRVLPAAATARALLARAVQLATEQVGACTACNADSIGSYHGIW